MNGIDDAAAAMAAARDRLDATANDLANVGSDGFHGHLVHTRLSQRGLVTESVADERQGALRATGRPFDLALVGRGAFRVAAQRPHAPVEATRDGAFTRDRFGYLVDDRGRALLGADGTPVRVEENARIDPNGAFVVDGRTVARLALPEGTRVRSGFIESSNVNGIARMVDVIDAQRAFESASKVLTAIDEARQKATEQVGQVQS